MLSSGTPSGIPARVDKWQVLLKVILLFHNIIVRIFHVRLWGLHSLPPEKIEEESLYSLMMKLSLN
jgi:hypothetical protein